ncbi:MAG: helix-turn-helix domain-containing protein [Firmicutes bacterium]|nr:helix-turn-helix domain-containing protein [Bacillota bacterium]
MESRGKYDSNCGLYHMHKGAYDKFDYSLDEKNLPFSALPQNISKGPLHHHNHYEFYYLNQGSVNFNVECESYVLEKGDVIILNYHEFHSMTALVENSSRITVVMDEEFLRKLNINVDIFDFFRRKPIGRNNKIPAGLVEEYGLDELFSKLGGIVEHSLENDLVIACIMIQMLVIMSNLFKRKEFQSKSKQYSSMHKGLIQYIHDNIEKSLTLDIIAKEFYLSKYHICHEFKKHVGISLYEYILNKKVMIANNYIRQGMPANEASIKMGFDSYPCFYRACIKFLKHAPTRGAKKATQQDTQ